MEHGESGRKFELDFETLKQLVDLVKSSGVGRIRVSNDGFEVEVESARQQAVVCCTGGAGGVASENGVGHVAQHGEEPTQESGNLVSSPIVGTFYSSPAPGKPAFVAIGDSVKKGDVLYIIESMKLMNEVKSEFDGVVKKIFVESGDPVEFGQPIMLIE